MKYIKHRPALQKTFFYERDNGTWFACGEVEASLHEKRNSKKVRLVGVSDGSVYFQMMNDKIREVNEKVGGVEKKFASKKMSQSRYDIAIEKLNNELLQASKDATLAEYERAKGHIERPVDPNAQRIAGLSNGQQQSVSRLIG